MKQKQPGIFFKGVIMLFCWLLSVETSAQQPQLVVPLAHHRAPYVQLNAAGDLLLSEEDQLLLLWDVNYRRVRYNLSIPGRRLINSTFSPGGYELLIVTDDSAAQLLDLRTGSVIRKFALAGTKLVYGTFSGDGRSVVTAHSDSSIVRWELSRPAPVLHRKWGGLPHLVVADATGEHVFIQHDSTYVDESTGDLIKARRAALLHFASNRRRPISGFVSFIPARNAVLRFEYVARLEDVNSGRLLLQIPLSFNGAYCLSLDKKYVAMGDNFEISVWNLALGKREQKQTVAIESGIITELQLHAFADSNRRILASYDNEVQSVNWRARRSVFTGWDTLRLLVDQDGLAPQGFAVNRDAHRIAASYASGRIRVFNLADLRFPALLEGYSEPVNDLLYDKRFHRLFSRHGYKNIKCWDLSRMRLDYTIADTTFCGAANAFRLCSDEKNLFIDVCEGFEGYYDVATGKSLPIDSVGDDCRRALRVTSNGTRLQKGYVQGWSIMAAQTDSVVRMIDTSGFVKQAFLSPGGDLLVFTTTVLDASGNDNGIDVQLVDLLKGDTVRLLQSAFNLEEVHFGARRQLIVITKDQGTLLFDLPSATRRYLGEFRSAAFISDSVLALSSLSDIVLYHLPQQRVQAQLLALQNDDFLVLLPNGYYSAHLRNLGKLHYTKNGKIVSFEQLDLRYNRPDKVLEALGSTDTLLIAAYRNAHLKRMQRLGIDTAAFGDAYAAPDGDFVGRERIAAQQRGKTLALRYRAADSVSTIAGFNVWINEVPLFGAKGITLTGNRSTFDTTIRIVLSRGENRIEASVRNRAGLESYRMPLFVSYLPPDSVAARTHFIGIGVNQFANSSYNLSWSVKDIRDLCGKLREKYPAMLIDTLFDEQVTREHILALKKKLALLEEEDRVIISYSGHGVLSKKLDYFLSTWNIDFNDPSVSGLPYEEFEALLDSIRPRRKLVLIDACHSGEVDKEDVAKIDASRPQLDSSGIRPRGISVVQAKKHLGMSSAFELMQELFVQVSRGTGATIIAAAGGTQFALERGDLKNGVFTYTFLDALQRFGHLSVGQLSSWLSTQVEQLTGGLQRPASRGNTNQYDWMVW